MTKLNDKTSKLYLISLTLGCLAIGAHIPVALASGGVAPINDDDQNDSFDVHGDPKNSPFKLQFGDVFKAEGHVEPVDGGYTESDTAEGPQGDQYCKNTLTTTGRFNFEYINYDFPIVRYATFKYHSSEDRRSIFEKYVAGNSPNYNCTWDHQRIDKEIPGELNDMRKNKQYLVLDRISDQANAISGRLVVRSEALKTKLASKHDYLETFVNARFSSCVDEDGNTITSFLPDATATTDLATNLQALRKRSNVVFTKCTLQVDSAKMAGDIVKSGSVGVKHLEKETMFWNVIQSQPENLFTSSEQGINSGSYQRTYNRIGAVASVPNEQLALAAAKSFKEFIANDYGDLLYNLNDHKASKEEAAQVAKAFFQTHSDEMKQWFTVLDENWRDVSLMNKVSILISFKDMYTTIAQIEKDVIASQTVNLDRIVKSLGK